ncbi:hypothetical protein D9619_009083 [Psilocybe cf. subviscida]|uniref:Uncharacterized protein n=1 Tax=Psilocybe cf. subviscida TaxID=2480587 RepID=A0A8H5BVW8_9AGAR|nr:hypothetical protein D9619_009083 [Psilocybe cf. subviscida]
MSSPTPPTAPKPAAKWASKMGAAVRRSPSLLSLGRSSEADDDTKSLRRSASRNLKAPLLMPTLTMEGPGREEAAMKADAIVPSRLAGTVTEPAVEIPQPPTVVDPHVETNIPALPPPPGTPKPPAKWASKMGAAIRRSLSLLSLGRSSETDDDTKSLRRSASRNLKMSQTSPPSPPPVQSSPSMSTSTLEVHVRKESIINDDLLGSSPLARIVTESAIEIPQSPEVVDPYAETNTPVPLPPSGTPKPAVKWVSKMGAAIRRPSSLLSLRRPSAPSSEADTDAKSLRRSTSRSLKMPQAPPPLVESPPSMPTSISESPTGDEAIMKDAVGVSPQPEPLSMPTPISETTATEEAAMEADVVGSSPLATDIGSGVEAPQPTEAVDTYADTNTPSSEADVGTKSMQRSTSRGLRIPQAPPPPPIESPLSMPPPISESPATEEATMKADVVGFSPLARTITESAVEPLQPTEVVDPYADTNIPEADADTGYLRRNMSPGLKVPLTPTRPVQSPFTARNPPVAPGAVPLPTLPSMPTPPALETSAREESTTKADVVDPFPLARTVREPVVEAEAAKSVESTEPASAAEIKTAAPADEATSAVGLVPLPVIDAFVGNPRAFTDLPEEHPQPTEVVDLYAETYTPAASPPAEEPAVSDAPEPMAVAPIEQHSRTTAGVAARPATDHIDKPIPEPAVEPTVAAVPKSTVPVEKRSRSTAEVAAQPETIHVDKLIPKLAVAPAKESTVAAAPRPTMAPTEHHSRPRAVAEAASIKQFNSYLQVAIGVFTVVAFSASVLRWRR